LIKPVILDIYPEFETDARPPFLDSFEMVPKQKSLTFKWTFPSGFKIYDENFKTLNVTEEEPAEKSKEKSKNKQAEEVPLDPTSEKNEMFSFVMTDGNYQKRYCTTLLIHV
jgi:uDENN domain